MKIGVAWEIKDYESSAGDIEVYVCADQRDVPVPPVDCEQGR